jgi:hypothetical protein
MGLYCCLIVLISALFEPAALILQDLGSMHSDPRGITLADDVPRREANHAKNESQDAQK